MAINWCGRVCGGKREGGTGRAPLCTGMSKAPNHDACYHSVKARYATVRSLFLSGDSANIFRGFLFPLHSTLPVCIHPYDPLFQFPSARASQAIAKCRKKQHGHVRKTKAGKNLKRWKAEKWKNTRTGRPCGNSKDSGEYCRPSKRVSSKTPKMRPKNASANKALKARGLRAKRAT